MRHGKTDWNLQRRLQGRTDIPINDEGRKMAEKAALECRDINIDVCYCSPLIRAKETAEIFLKNRNIPIITDERLVEMCFGIYEGVKNSSDIPGSPMKDFFETPEKFKGVENGETFDDLFARTGEFLKEVIEPQLAEGKDILIIGHGAMNSSIICQIRNLSIEHFWDEAITNCKLVKLI